jgi:serine/threonine protein kinase
MGKTLTCRQCGAPLTPHRFARSIVCPYCGTTNLLDEASVSVATFRESFRVWNSPATYHLSTWISVCERYWAVEHLIAQGEIAEVYSGRAARWPTELVILKVLRSHADADLFENEWRALQKLQQSNAPGADTFTALLPQPVAHGKVSEGLFTGRQVSLFRWTSGFHHTFEEVARVYPHGIPPRASIWVWRRILEVLSFIHASGMVHGAVVPLNLLLQEHEHGVLLVGYSRAGRPGDPLVAPAAALSSFYPAWAMSRPLLSTELDLALSARCVAALLGGHPQTVALPATVPAQLAEIVRRVALAVPGAGVTSGAWAIREELGQIANAVFGPAQFIPIDMPA